MKTLSLLAAAEPGGGFGGGGEGGGTITNPALGDLAKITGISFFQKSLPKAIGLAFVIGVVIFLFIFIMGAIQWISSGGDKAALESARSKITNAFIGIVLLFASFAIIKVIEGFFGIDILTLDIGVLKIQ